MFANADAFPVNQRLLITGGTGYLGSRLITHLLESGGDVAVLSRRRAPSPGSPAWFTHDGSTGSVTEALRRASPDQVIHLAASYVRNHEPINLEQLLEANVTFGSMVLEAMHEVGCRRFVYAGSVFQRSAGDASPRNLYAATKNAFEEVLDFYRSWAEIEDVRLTLCDVYGEDDPRQRLLNAAVAAAENGSTLQVPRHDPFLLPIHIDDVVRALEKATLMSPETGPFWVGPAAAVKLSEIIALVARLAETPLTIERVDLPALPGDTLAPTPFATLPGWFPGVTLEQGVQRMIDACRKSGASTE